MDGECQLSLPILVDSIFPGAGSWGMSRLLAYLQIFLTGTPRDANRNFLTCSLVASITSGLYHCLPMQYEAKKYGRTV